MLGDHLRALGLPTVLAREPGSTPLGERIRETTLSDPRLEIPAWSELFLMLAARAAFVEQVVRPSLREGRVVVADRFELSTLAYQGSGRGLPEEEIRRCNALATGGLHPDATLLLELDPQDGVQRQRAAGKVPDRMELEAAEFHRRVATGYVRFAALVPDVDRVDASGDPQTVHLRILSVLRARFSETFV